jgi:FeS assembly SUF system protein
MTPPKRSLNVINPNDKVEELRRAFAAEPGLTPLTPAEEVADENETLMTPMQANIVAALRTVFDPEIPLNVYDLGLIYNIAEGEAGAITITMTLTAPGCPVAGDIVADVQRKVQAVAGVSSVNVDLVFDPPWSKERMSEAALLELGLL